MSVLDGYTTYAIGQTAMLEAYSEDDDGNPLSPTDPQILLRAPDGTESSLTVIESPVGHIFALLYIDTEIAPGLYLYRIVTSDDAFPHYFYVSASQFDAPLG